MLEIRISDLTSDLTSDSNFRLTMDFLDSTIDFLDSTFDFQGITTFSCSHFCSKKEQKKDKHNKRQKYHLPKRKSMNLSLASHRTLYLH